MSSKWGWATLLVAVAFITMLGQSASAQPGRRGGGMFGRGGIVGLAGAESVQKDLEVDAETKEKLAAISSDYQAEAREQYQAAGGGERPDNDEDRQKLFAKMAEVSRTLNEKYTPKIKEALKPEQFKRLQQISWQVGGSFSFTDPQLAKELDLTKDQQQKIVEVNHEFGQKQRELFGGGNFAEAMSKMRELSQERDKKAEEVLSKEQQEKLKELKGKPFDVSSLQGGRPGGGRRKNDDK